MNLKCACKDWKENIDKVISTCIISTIHGHGGYEGKKFVYCPWCKLKLKEVKD